LAAKRVNPNFRAVERNEVFSVNMEIIGLMHSLEGFSQPVRQPYGQGQ